MVKLNVPTWFTTDILLKTVRATMWTRLPSARRRDAYDELLSFFSMGIGEEIYMRLFVQRTGPLGLKS